MTLAVGADHGGYELKARLLRGLRRAGHRVRDVGTNTPEPCDYPRYAAKVASAVSAGRADRGVLICKSGGGMAIVANKFLGVRAVVAPTISAARHSRQHNDANVLVLGTIGLPPARAERILDAWLAAEFEGGRHAKRVRQIEQLERTICQRGRASR